MLSNCRFAGAFVPKEQKLTAMYCLFNELFGV
jgi:hypothetical protein